MMPAATALAAALCTLLLPAASLAQAGGKLPPTVAAVIDYQQILRDSRAARAIRDQVESRRRLYQEQIAQEEQRLHEADKDLASQRTVLSPDDFAERRATFESQVAEVQRMAAILLASVGIPLLAAEYPRTYLDPNRHAGDVDLDLLADRLAAAHAGGRFDVDPQECYSLTPHHLAQLNQLNQHLEAATANAVGAGTDTVRKALGIASSESAEQFFSEQRYRGLITIALGLYMLQELKTTSS